MICTFYIISFSKTIYNIQKHITDLKQKYFRSQNGIHKCAKKFNINDFFY